jgi:hypothetical protein
MSERDPFGGNDALRPIIVRMWTTPEHAEWIAKTHVISPSDLREWMETNDIEILGFGHAPWKRTAARS